MAPYVRMARVMATDMRVPAQPATTARTRASSTTCLASRHGVAPRLIRSAISPVRATQRANVRLLMLLTAMRSRHETAPINTQSVKRQRGPATASASGITRADCCCNDAGAAPPTLCASAVSSSCAASARVPCRNRPNTTSGPAPRACRLACQSGTLVCGSQISARPAVPGKRVSGPKMPTISHGRPSILNCAPSAAGDRPNRVSQNWCVIITSARP